MISGEKKAGHINEERIPLSHVAEEGDLCTQRLIDSSASGRNHKKKKTSPQRA